MSSEIQERVARAIYESRYGRPERDDYWNRRVKDMREIAEMFPNSPLGGDATSDAFRAALAAMKAMREPTEERSRSSELGAKVRKVAAQLSVERFNGWANPLVSDLVDAADFLEGKTPMNESSEAVLSADAEISLAEGGKDD